MAKKYDYKELLNEVYPQYKFIDVVRDAPGLPGYEELTFITEEIKEIDVQIKFMSEYDSLELRMQRFELQKKLSQLLKSMDPEIQKDFLPRCAVKK